MFKIHNAIHLKKKGNIFYFLNIIFLKYFKSTLNSILNLVIFLNKGPDIKFYFTINRINGFCMYTYNI